MAYRFSLFLITFFVSFSSLAFGVGESFNIGSHNIAPNNSTTVYEIESFSTLPVAEGRAETIDCEAELISSSGESILLAQAGCCRICTVGKACGNSCISKKYKCHKGRGCACNG